MARVQLTLPPCDSFVKGSDGRRNPLQVPNGTDSPRNALDGGRGGSHAGRAVLNAKKKLFQNMVFSKEPADSTCLHPGVPNCSTMSP